MIIETPYRIPLYTEGYIYVSRTIHTLGISLQEIARWLFIGQSLHSFVMEQQLLERWCPIYLYTDTVEAIQDQFRDESHEQAFLRLHKARGVAICDFGHKFCRMHFKRRDRVILFGAQLGGQHPFTLSALHETAHHHLYQKWLLPFSEQTNQEQEGRCNLLADRWQRELPQAVLEHDSGAVIRALDILVTARRRQQCHQPTRKGTPSPALMSLWARQTSSGS